MNNNIQLEIAADIEMQLMRLMRKSQQVGPDGESKLPLEKLRGPDQIDQEYRGPMICLMIQCDHDRQGRHDVIRLKKIAGIFQVHTQAYVKVLEQRRIAEEQRQAAVENQVAVAAERVKKLEQLQRMWAALGADGYYRTTELARPDALSGEELDAVSADWLAANMVELDKASETVQLTSRDSTDSQAEVAESEAEHE